MANKDTIYLPQQHTRIGKAGYKGKNIEVVATPAPKNAAPKALAPAVAITGPAQRPRKK